MAKTLKVLPYVVFGAIGVSVLGCAPPKIQGPTSPDTKASGYFLNPKVGVTTKREIGEPLYEEGTKTISKKHIVTIKNNVTSSMDLGYKLVAASGFSGPLLKRFDNQVPLLCMNVQGVGTFIGCLADTNNDGRFDKSMFPLREKYFDLSNEVPYDITLSERIMENKSDYYVDVLYQGLSKGVIKVSYREFVDGMARPAFTQDVNYELENDGTAVIGFKGMRMKVLKATNQNIEYILEQPIPALADVRKRSN